MGMESYKVLIIDDDIVIAQSTAEYFNMFDLKTAFVTGYDEAIDFLEKNMVSLLLLDINLGDKSGFELCKKVREDYDMPILFISARTSDDDVLIALNIGGDDYIKKPYTLSILRLIAVSGIAVFLLFLFVINPIYEGVRRKDVFARYEKAKEDAQKAAEAADGNAAGGASDGKVKSELTGIVSLTDKISLDTGSHKLKAGADQISLKAMEYKLLVYLLENSGRVVTKDELLKNVWDDEFIGEGTLAVHIRHLREKIEDDPKDPQVIKTIWGVGYIIEGVG